MYRQLGQDDYDKYLDDLGQWNTDRNFQYGVYRDSVEDQRYADETAWEREQYGNTQAENQKLAAQDRIAAYLAAGGKIVDLDQDLIAASGLTTSELSAQEKYYTQQAAQKYKSSSGSSSGSSSSGSGKPRLTAAQTISALEKGVINDSTLSAYEYWFGQPYEEDGKPAKITDVSQLGTAAMSIANAMSRADSPSKLGTFAERIQNGLDAGTITEAEADFLMRAIGF